MHHSAAPAYSALLLLGSCLVPATDPAVEPAAIAPPDARPAWWNPDQHLRATFRADGVEIGDALDGTRDIPFSLTAWGRLDALQRPAAVAPVGDDLEVRYTRSGLVEWWENRPEGLEQGFTVPVPPAGAGPLVFEIRTLGAVATVHGTGSTAELVSPLGQRLHVGNLAAWDETQRDLPTWIEATSEGLRFLVDDTAAEGAVTVDPLLTSPAWVAESNVIAADFGWSVAGAGDVNGDGFGDVIVGAPNYQPAYDQVGAAYVYLGSVAGLESTASWMVEGPYDAYSPYAPCMCSDFGYSVASAGDVNGDGYNDVVVGYPRYLVYGWYFGGAAVYHGSSAGLATSAAWDWELETEPPYVSYDGTFGESVASAGDVNGDGYDDVIVGQYKKDNGLVDVGAARVFHGSANGLGNESWVAYGTTANEQFGLFVASAGDVNGDAYDDVIVASKGTDVVTVYHGSTLGLEALPAVTLVPGGSFTDNDHIGSAGDVNGDGFDDVVVGMQTWSNPEQYEGKAIVYLGSAAGVSPVEAWSAESDVAYGYFGRSVAAAGDVDEDGFGDLAVGMPGYANGQAGEGGVHIYLGSAAGLAATAAATLESNWAGAGLGVAVAAAGDVDGDGYPDLIGGAEAYDNGSYDEGAAFLFRGVCGDADLDLVCDADEVPLLEAEGILAGGVNTWSLTDAGPDTTWELLVGNNQGSTPVNGCIGLSVDFVVSKKVDTQTADAVGTALFDSNVPPQVAGRSLAYQALDRAGCRVTNRVIVAYP